VRHQLVASIRPVASLSGAQQGARPANLRLQFQISDHARDSNFYGMVAAEFDTADLAAGAAEAVVWEDARCHSERGLPKITLVAVEGTISEGGKVVPFAAIIRQRGLRLPLDEIIARKDLSDTSSAALAIQGETTRSRLRVGAKLLVRACLLDKDVP
jgi:hypothetical protein